MVSIYQALLDVESKGLSAALCTIIGTSGSTPRHETSKMLVYSDGSFIGTVGGGEIENRIHAEALLAIKEGTARVARYSMVNPERGDPGICGGTVEVFVEPILPKPNLLVIGGGHVGKAVAHLGRFIGWRVTVSDDRIDFCTKEVNPDADDFLPMPMEEIPAHLSISPTTYIVLTTRGAVVDIPGLPALLNTNAGYIGVIGSKRRWAVTKKGMLEAGVTEEQISRVHSPIGLELQAETPEEIALSIISEIVMLRNHASGKSMKG